MPTKKHPGLWANIHDKQERIKKGSDEAMRHKGEKGAPTQKAIRHSQSTSKKKHSRAA
jgi:hypothetical protein